MLESPAKPAKIVSDARSQAFRLVSDARSQAFRLVSDARSQAFRLVSSHVVSSHVVSAVLKQVLVNDDQKAGRCVTNPLMLAFQTPSIPKTIHPTADRSPPIGLRKNRPRIGYL